MVKRPTLENLGKCLTALLSYHITAHWHDQTPKYDKSPWPLGQSPQGFPPYFKGDDGGSTASRETNDCCKQRHLSLCMAAHSWGLDGQQIEEDKGNKNLWTQVQLAWGNRLKETWSSWSFWRVSKTRITSRNYWSAVQSETSRILRFSSWFRQNDKNIINHNPPTSLCDNKNKTPLSKNTSLSPPGQSLCST